MSWLARGLIVLCSVVCLSAAEPQVAGGYVWNLPKGFPQPRIPADNPMTAAKVELGRRLFYDTRLSVNGKASCATCHKQELAFTDGRAVSLGATGEAHSRSSMSLVNVAYGAALTWSNPTLKTLEKQALIPMYGESPLELGLRTGDDLPAKLRATPVYAELFRQAFPESRDPFTRQNAVYAIASFERSMISADSPYDRYHTVAMTVPFPIQPSAERSYSIRSRYPVFAAMVDLISAMRPIRRSAWNGLSSFTTQAYIIWPERFHFRLQMWGFTNSPKRRLTSVSSRLLLCGTSR